MIMKVTCKSQEETRLLAKTMAKKLRGGEIMQLKGDVGSGKTTFTIGLAAGLECSQRASSPTFTICNTYDGRLKVHHCDFYRLQDDKLIENELTELIDDQAVIVLEWAENISSLDSSKCIFIEISAEDDTTRIFEMHIPARYDYLYK